MTSEDKQKAVQAWIDTMKERFDKYKTDRNEFLADVHLPPKEIMFYRDVVLPFAENTLIMDNIAASEGIMYETGGVHNRLIIRVYFRGTEIQAKYKQLQRLECDNIYETMTEEGKKCWIKYPDHFPYLLKPVNSRLDLSQALNDNELFFPEAQNNGSDVAIALPSEHAFYSILENFIRNSAKHNKSKLEEERKDLTIYISLDDEKEDGSADPEFYHLTIFDSVSSVPPVTLLGLLKRLDDSLLDETGKPRRENLGIADMKINAHLLASSEEITDSVLREALQIVVFNKLPEENSCNVCNFCEVTLSDKTQKDEQKRIEELNTLLEQVVCESETTLSDGCKVKGYRFGYRFKLAKAKKVCWIGREEDLKTKEKLKAKGIYLFKDFEEFKNLPNKSIALYQFALLELSALHKWNEAAKPNNGTAKENELQEIFLKLPYRVMLNNINGESILTNSVLKKFVLRRQIQLVKKSIDCSIDQENNDYTILKNCWENWLTKWLGESGVEKKPHLFLSFETENPNWMDFDGNDYFNFTQLNGQKNGTSKITIEKNEVCILFGQHGGGLDRINKLSWKDHTFQSIGKGSADFASIFYPPGEKEKKELLCYELIEAGLSRILVLDERLCVNMCDPNLEIGKIKDCLKYDNNSKPSLHWHLAATGRLFLIKRYLNRVVVADGNVENDFTCTLKTEIDSNLEFEVKYGDNPINSTFDCIIMHRTFLNEEWLAENIKGKSLEEKQKQFLKMLQEKIPFIIVISGGGAPYAVKGNYKFKPFSGYDRFFGSQFSKFRITKYSLT